jgi:hypothetical protein
MFQTYRKANRKSWFNIDNQIKNNEIEIPKAVNKKVSLLKKPDMNKPNNQVTPTAEYVLAIRQAVNKMKG